MEDKQFYLKKLIEDDEILMGKFNTVYIHGVKYVVKIEKKGACKHEDVHEEPTYNCNTCEEFLDDSEFKW